MKNIIKIDEKGYKIYEKHVAFWGSLLSNFGPCFFELDGRKYNWSEQAFMVEKALCFHDMEAVDRIMAAESPNQCKQIGREVKNYDDKVWSEKRVDAMYKVVKAKFEQDEKCRKFLLNPKFEGKKFVEGSPFDKIWGVGIDYRDDRVDDETKWNGQNLLGKTLDRVRDELRLDNTKID